ncbi:MAG: type II toxin-antitoxin system RatA family toxin [Chromatiales bacterium]
MKRIERSALVPYPPSAMFALVADVESYPAFLPWCADARVLSRQGGEITARLTLARSGIRQAFVTRNTHREFERIDMQLVEGPFKRLKGCWNFEPVGSHGCIVALHLDFEFASKLVALTFGKAFQPVAGTLMEAFCARARELYGSQSSAR